MPSVLIESLDHEGRGVAHVDGKTVFIEGGLPGEYVDYSSHLQKRRHELASVVRIHRPSSQRTTPVCAHFGVCGGCSMQHLEPVAQMATKQRVLEDAFWHISRLRPEQIYAPIGGQSSGYRLRARFSVRSVPTREGVLVGFREKRSSFVATMTSCAVVPGRVSALIPALRQLVATLSIPDRIPQIELAVAGEQIALTLRHIEPVNAADQTALRGFADRHQVVWYLQPKGPDSAHLFYPLAAPALTYELPDFDLSLAYSPADFTQINEGVNRVLVRRAMALLAPRSGERIADMFCGLGNFSLPIARMGACVVGLEACSTLVTRAISNAARNGLAQQCRFDVIDLFKIDEPQFAALGTIDKLLIDPPREGAAELVRALPVQNAPHRIVYVSCNPSTLARDAAILVYEKGYRLRGAGIAGMFPHTSHVESIALFER